MAALKPTLLLIWRSKQIRSKWKTNFWKSKFRRPDRLKLCRHTVTNLIWTMSQLSSGARRSKTSLRMKKERQSARLSLDARKNRFYLRSARKSKWSDFRSSSELRTDRASCSKTMLKWNRLNQLRTHMTALLVQSNSQGLTQLRVNLI